MAMPAPSAALAMRTAFFSLAHQPVRIFSVTGTPCGLARGDHRLDDRQRQRLVLHQRRAGPLVAHLLGRAAHVDVDDLGAAGDVVGRGLGHHRRVGAGDLHRDRRGLAVVVGAPAGLQRRPQVLPRRHHLADRVAGAEALAELTKRSVGDARHRRGKQPIRQRDVADAHGGGEGRLLKNGGRSIAAPNRRSWPVTTPCFRGSISMSAVWRPGSTG